MHHQPDELQGVSLKYAPVNELGVVYLFAHVAKKLRLRIEEIQAGFPDCIAYQKTSNGTKKIRIEFEYKSRNFLQHKHDHRKCDWIVCWEHNWPAAPKNLNIFELRTYFGLGFNVWIQPVGGDYREILSNTNSSDLWSVASIAHRNDLVLFYRTGKDGFIQDIFKLTGPVEFVTARWKSGKDYMAPIKRICKLPSPIFLEDLRRDKIISTSGFVRSGMQGRPNISEYWPYMYEKIIKRNPLVKNRLKPYAPDAV